MFSGNWRILAPGDRELIRLIAQHAVKHRHGGIRRPGGRSGPIVTVVCLQLFIGGDFTQHRRLRSVSLLGINAAIPPIANAPRLWQVLINKRE